MIRPFIGWSPPVLARRRRSGGKAETAVTYDTERRSTCQRGRKGLEPLGGAIPAAVARPPGPAVARPQRWRGYFAGGERDRMGHCTYEMPSLDASGAQVSSSGSALATA